MQGLKPLFFAVVAVTAALTAALAFESVYEVSIQTRPPDPLMLPTSVEATSAPSETAAALRLVDSGGVGIPLTDQWGTDYSHDRRVFHEVILREPPYVDEVAFHRVEGEWRAYVERMLEYGNNAVTVPLLLQLIDFDRVNASNRSTDAVIYDQESPFRARHAAVRRHFAPLFEWTDRRGMDVFLETDVLTLTAPLSRYLGRLAPDASPLGIDTSDPAVWEVYRAGLEELFDEVPSIQGLVIRFGEGGNLYNTEGWPYRSEMAVRSAKSLRAMLRGLLPVFEARNKTLVLRSWTVGIGQIGKLHLDPQVYDAVLGDIDSPALVVSTKFTAGDFFSYLPLNPTLARGRHRRLVELQAKPEFEGFGAFPNFLGEEHARALRALAAANPQIVGTYVLTQAGGPLRAGPRALYPLHGFWLWTDANVFVASRLAIDPGADVRQLARQWAEARFGNNPRIVDAITSVLTETRAALLEGFYIRSFAEQGVRVPGLELPPLMWIFEWDMVGGWHSLLSIVYRGSRDRIDLSIKEGYAAVATVRRVRLQLQSAFAAAGRDACAQACDEALRSLEYQETLFGVLAAWRQAFLSYYRWLDTGAGEAWNEWRAGRRQFETAAAQHVARFGGDLDFPAFDLRSATQAITFADRAPWARLFAAGLVAGLITLIGIGSPIGQRWRAPERLGGLARIGRLAWTAAITPWRLGREPVDLGAAIALTTLGLALVAVLVATLTGFADVGMAVGSSLPFALAALAFESTAIGVAGRQGRGHLLVASVAPLVPGAIILFVLIAYFGPVGFWYSFWVSPMFRVAFLTTLLAMLLWTTYVMLATRIRDGWYGLIGRSFTAAGAGLVALTALLPDWSHTLRFLDRPLNLAPATDTMLFALRTYAGVSLDIGSSSWLLGALLLSAGYFFWLQSVMRLPAREDSR